MRPRLTLLPALLLLALACLLAPLPAAAEEETLLWSDLAAQSRAAVAVPADPLERQWWVWSLVAEGAERWGIPFNVAWGVVWCESRADPFAHNRVSGAAGLWQFTAGTWRWASAAAGFAGASPYDPVASTETALRMIALGEIRHWASCTTRI